MKQLFFLSVLVTLSMVLIEIQRSWAEETKIPVGLQLYSLRDQLAKDVPGTLDKVRDMGFRYVELAGTYNLTPEEFKKELDSRGLKAIGGHFGYGVYRDDVESIAREAKVLGLECAGCAWIEHEEPFDETECRRAIDVFNNAGEALAKHGIKFYYHTHGYEFQPHGEGTLFDLLMAETKPEFVCYQMDVFWIAHAGQRPAALLEKYPGRFELTHLKDMKRGTETGVFTGHSDPANSVVIGTGQIAFPPLLQAAKKTGVKWHFIEDESPISLEQIPQSLRVLEEMTR